jgi:hypothetical protein
MKDYIQINVGGLVIHNVNNIDVAVAFLGNVINKCK